PPLQPHIFDSVLLEKFIHLRQFRRPNRSTHRLLLLLGHEIYALLDLGCHAYVLISMLFTSTSPIAPSPHKSPASHPSHAHAPAPPPPPSTTPTLESASPISSAAHIRFVRSARSPFPSATATPVLSETPLPHPPP